MRCSPRLAHDDARNIIMSANRSHATCSLNLLVGWSPVQSQKAMLALAPVPSPSPSLARLVQLAVLLVPMRHQAVPSLLPLPLATALCRWGRLWRVLLLLPPRSTLPSGCQRTASTARVVGRSSSSWRFCTHSSGHFLVRKQTVHVD